MPRFAVLPVAGALGLTTSGGTRSAIFPLAVRRPLVMLRVAVLDDDVIAEKPRRLGAGVADQGLSLVEFQSEGLPEERRPASP